jgi:chromosomal replication initiation ATPase DnaA
MKNVEQLLTRVDKLLTELENLRLIRRLKLLETRLNKLERQAANTTNELEVEPDDIEGDDMPAGLPNVVRVGLRIVADYYRLKPETLIGRSRRQHIAIARQMLCYVLRECSTLSLPQIGHWLGGRDHTTVKCAYYTIKQRTEREPGFAATADRLVAEVKARLTGRLTPVILPNGKSSLDA